MSWTRLTCNATAPANASYAQVQCILNGSGAAYFTDIRLVPCQSNEYTYDANGNYKLKSEDASYNETQYTYDAIGNESSVTDPCGFTTDYYYDNLNNLNQVNDPLNNNSYYQYDSNSNRIYARGPGSSSATDNTDATYFGPSPLNQLALLTDAGNQSATYTYDMSGNLWEISWPNKGQNEIMTYDNANRLSTLTLSTGQNYTYTYGDGTDDVTKVTDQTGASYSYTYDGDHRVKSTTDPLGNVLSYTYDKDSNLTVCNGCSYSYAGDDVISEVNLPLGKTIQYNRDSDGRICSVMFPDFNYDYRYIYYYPNNRISEITDPGYPGQTPIYYCYYSNGNIDNFSNWNGGNGFSYDNDGRLTGWSYAPGSLYGGSDKNLTYSYNAAGDLLSNGTRSFTYNSSNEITSAGFTYDQNGNMTSDGTYDYTYNAENQLVQVNTVSGTLVATYIYNHDGTRRSKTVNSSGPYQGTTDYYWDASGNLVKESGPNGTINYFYVSGKLVALEKNNTVYTVHDDQRGDIATVTSSSGWYDPV